MIYLAHNCLNSFWANVATTRNAPGFPIRIPLFEDLRSARGRRSGIEVRYGKLKGAQRRFGFEHIKRRYGYLRAVKSIPLIHVVPGGRIIVAGAPVRRHVTGSTRETRPRPEPANHPGDVGGTPTPTDDVIKRKCEKAVREGRCCLVVISYDDRFKEPKDSYSDRPADRGKEPKDRFSEPGPSRVSRGVRPRTWLPWRGWWKARWFGRRNVGIRPSAGPSAVEHGAGARSRSSEPEPVRACAAVRSSSKG